MGNFIVTPPSMVAVISGPDQSRMVIGECSFQRWFIESCEYLSLELITLAVNSREAETVRGVRVGVSGTCQVKVDAFTGEDLEQNLPQITLACQHFLGKSSQHIHDSLLRTLEGHQRQILGTLTVEELYKDRAAFSQRVREHIREDLKNMGFALVSYTVNQVEDTHGYMAALGATQTALVKREAAEGQSKNESEGQKRVAENESSAKAEEAAFRAEAHVNVAAEEEKKAAADRDLAIKRAAFKSEVNTAEASAQKAFEIESAKQGQTVIREQAKQKAEEALIMLEVEGTYAKRTQKEKEGSSLAALIEERNRAEGVKAAADAQAHVITRMGAADAAAIRAKGEAQADAEAASILAKGEAIANAGVAEAKAIMARGEAKARVGEIEANSILARGEAEAKVLKLRGDAFATFGNAAIAHGIVERLPDIAREVAAPLAQTEKMVFISGEGGGAGSRFTKDVGSIMSQLPTTVEALTGVDVTKGLERYLGGGDGGGKEDGGKDADEDVDPAFAVMSMGAKRS